MDTDSILTELTLALDATPAAYMVGASTQVLRRTLPIRGLWLYVADYSEDRLRVVSGHLGEPPPAEDFSVRGTLPGRVYLTREQTVVDGEDGPIMWIPVFRRSESVGVLALALDRGAELPTRLATAIALAVGSAVLGARRHSDVFELARGAELLRLAAAMQWDLLPLPTYQDPLVEVAGRVEPAYDIGGDAFDFAANAETMEIGVFDAMGHGLGSTLLTTLAVGAYRFGRRRREGLAGVAGDIDEAVAGHMGGEAFVTGHLCRLDLASGQLGWLNAGHPLPLLIRDHTASPIEGAEPCLPFGLGIQSAAAMEVGLQPNDIVLFYSDGVIEARPNGGPEFGMERFLDMAGRHGDREVPLLVMVRQILDEVTDHAKDVLRDDATLVAVRWTGRGA
ncbi:MAG TPA: SpoIIE family protein phosphatase [Actinomycetota bacterium]|nr:SpoIIE family protein phosphatase [Actinomycetota bacterium]